LQGLIKAKGKNLHEAGWKSFGEWIDDLFGEGYAASLYATIQLQSVGLQS